MEETTYADPAVVSLVGERFVAIRVDADRRPDISERYSLGGWPTTAFLTADGALVGGGTFVSLDRMASALRHAADAFETRAAEITANADADARRAAASHDAPHLPTPAEPALVESTFASFDEEYGGFGIAPKFPLTTPIRLALHLHRDEKDDRAARIATLSLDAIGWGSLHDEADGGFYRCADARTWEQPHREKLLEVNAALIDLYVDAAEILGSHRYADRAQNALGYVQNWLADQVDGGWAGSAAGTRSRLTTSADGRRRRWRSIARCSRAGTARWRRRRSARRTSSTTTRLGAFAIASLERLLTTCYKPGHGVAHCIDGKTRVAGLLDDQFAVAGACLDAYDATGNIVYEMMAEELARHAMRTMWDERTGDILRCPGCRRRRGDRADAPARSRRLPRNCDAALVLRRLAASSGDHEFASAADSALAGVSGTAMTQGPQAAHYLLARRAARLR